MRKPTTDGVPVKPEYADDTQQSAANPGEKEAEKTVTNLRPRLWYPKVIDVGFEEQAPAAEGEKAETSASSFAFVPGGCFE
jgi:hypothetical protein